jgi:hypothetical protein
LSACRFTGLAFRQVFAAGLRRWLVLKPDVASIDSKVPIGVDADEHPGARDLGQLIANWTILEVRKRRLDVTESGSDPPSAARRHLRVRLGA